MRILISHNIMAIQQKPDYDALSKQIKFEFDEEDVLDEKSLKHIDYEQLLFWQINRILSIGTGIKFMNPDVYINAVQLLEIMLVGWRLNDPLYPKQIAVFEKAYRTGLANIPKDKYGEMVDGLRLKMSDAKFELLVGMMHRKGMLGRAYY